jgi:hypothetical protein
VIDPICFPWNPSVGQWYHVAVTRNASTYNLYLNGVRVATSKNRVDAIQDAAAPLTIGNAEDYFFKGRLDEVEIFDRALSASEIKSIYDAGSAGKCLPIRGSVSGIELEEVSCQLARKPPTKGVVSKQSSWDCTKGGLVAEPGQKIEIRLKGDASDTDIHKNRERD